MMVWGVGVEHAAEIKTATVTRLSAICPKERFFFIIELPPRLVKLRTLCTGPMLGGMSRQAPPFLMRQGADAVGAWPGYAILRPGPPAAELPLAIWELLSIRLRCASSSLL